MAKTNVLIIGAGKRVKSHLLAAVKKSKNVHLFGVYSRTPSRVTTTTDLAKINFAKVDIILVAITTNAVPQILFQLQKYSTKHIALFLDTPVLSPQNILASKFFRNFKSVRATEDWVSQPKIRQIKELTNQGKIGTLKKIYFFHSGYRYHALAAIRYLTGSAYFQKISYKKYNPEWAIFKIRLPAGEEAEIVEPRDYKSGRILIVGTQGSIADYALSGKDTIVIPHGVMDGQKIKGVMKLLEEVRSRNTSTYSAWDGLYDSLAVMLAEKFGIFFDLPLAGKSLFYYLIKITSLVP